MAQKKGADYTLGLKCRKCPMGFAWLCRAGDYFAVKCGGAGSKGTRLAPAQSCSRA